MLNNTYLSSTNQCSSSVMAALSEWVYVSGQTLTAAAQNITLSSLVGDTAEVYKICIYGIAGNAALSQSTLTNTFNADGGANYTFIKTTATAATVTTATTSGGTSIATSGANAIRSDQMSKERFYCEMIIYAKTGAPANGSRLFIIQYNGSGITQNFISGGYLERATNLTSIELLTTQADTFGVGSTIKIYKRAQGV
jgi:hypothetical protein